MNIYHAPASILDPITIDYVMKNPFRLSTILVIMEALIKFNFASHILAYPIAGVAKPGQLS